MISSSRTVHGGKASLAGLNAKSMFNRDPNSSHLALLWCQMRAAGIFFLRLLTLDIEGGGRESNSWPSHVCSDESWELLAWPARPVTQAKICGLLPYGTHHHIA